MAILLPYFVLLLANLLLFFLPLASFATDIITQSQRLLDDEGTTLVSENGKFELGFFSPGSSPHRQVDRKQRRKPSTSPQERLYCLLASSTKKASSPVVQLLGFGKLGMKLGWDLRTGLNRYLTAWKNWDDLSPGDFRIELMLHGLPEKVFWQGTTEYYRMGPWNGVSFSGSSSVNSNITLVSNKDEAYLMYTLNNESEIFIDTLNQMKYAMQRLVWDQDTQRWKSFGDLPRD
ncbi:G-type lectin S-receptor-like serine/threonine-protein kinase At4g27290 [Prosopis cineraria]|uniref:G-type lectin S-receptor-like serine/threonine-protein kinase At4g27290 n=1 Tax=Prosopis cineraria TaxID=364024 RepID=UPI00240FF9DB|nr:G-type lectin S-receptor-like serine/threonine-protein kinase At4g27290 [Prosopis cineraria]